MPFSSRDQRGSIRSHQEHLQGAGVFFPRATPPTTPKKVPPTPNNTPISTPPDSPTKSLATVISDITKEIEKMAKQKSQRPEKRHLVRWNDEMDKKLLLAIQHQCNQAGVGVPWEGVGREMGDKITGGAVIQHLAKLRARMVAQGLSVPPPLRRGGGSARISTASNSSISKPKKTPTKTGISKAKPATRKSTTPKLKKSGKKASPGSDESDEDDEEWDDDDSDANYGEPKVKRPKVEAKGPMHRAIKTEDSDEEVAPKRKYKKSKLPDHELSAYGTTDINGVPIDYDSDSEEDTKADVVGAGEPWLALEDDHASHPKTGKKSLPKKKSLVVSLPITPNKTRIMENVKTEEEEEDLGDMSYDESEEEDIGAGIESVVDGSQVLSTEEIEDAFSAPSMNQKSSGLAPGSANYVGTNPSYYAGQQGGSFNHGYNNNSSYQVDESLFDDDIFGQNDAMAQPSTFKGGLPDTGMLSNDFASQSAGNLEGLRSFASSQGTNGVLYPIQTSWPSSQGLASAYTNNTSVNHTPAGPSAGTDFSTGYFNSSEFDLGSFDDGNLDFSANDNTLFNTGSYDGNFVGGGFGSGFYGS